MSSIKFAEGNAYFFAHIHAWWCQDLLGINSDWCSAMSFFFKFAEGNAYFFAHIHAWWCQDLLGINSDWCSAMSFFFLSLREQFSYRLQDALGGVVNKPFWPKYKLQLCWLAKWYCFAALQRLALMTNRYQCAVVPDSSLPLTLHRQGTSTSCNC